MSLTTVSGLSGLSGARAENDCADTELVNAPGSVANAQQAFRKSRNSLLDINFNLHCKIHLSDTVEPRASLICFMNMLAIFAGTVPNSEFTCPAVTALPVRASTTT